MTRPESWTRATILRNAEWLRRLRPARLADLRALWDMVDVIDSDELDALLAPPSPGIRLSIAELQELTGARTRPKMIGILRDWGLTFRVGADGWPTVDREHYRNVMGAAEGEKTTGRRGRRAEPNFAALGRV